MQGDSSMEKVEFIDAYIERLLIFIYDKLTLTEYEDVAIYYISLALSNILPLQDEKAQAKIEFLRGYFPFLIRYLHAKVYASLFAGDIFVDSNFGTLFDKRVNNGDFRNISLYYLYMLLSSYFEAKKLDEPREISRDYLPLIRKIYPLYEVISL